MTGRSSVVPSAFHGAAGELRETPAGRGPVRLRREAKEIGDPNEGYSNRRTAVGWTPSAPKCPPVTCPYLGAMSPTPTDYHQLLTAVKQRVRAAKYRALQQVNQQQMQLYWDLG